MNPGEQVGPYKIVRRIGTGGMAEVFEALRPGLEGFRSKVALKCMRHTEDERFIQLFINEARLGSHLHHLNIVGIQDFNRAGDLYYIAMELVDGVDLQTVLNRLKAQGRVMEPALAVQIVIQALAGLGYAHRAVDDQGRPMGLIHRDVKPANLILSYEGVAKILDFGVAKAVISAFRTQEAVPRGTLAYMSPEQVAGERHLTPASDLFGVGAMLFEMLMQQSLYHEDNYARFLMAVAEADLREQLAAFRARFPLLSDVLARCLQRDVTRRFQSAEELSAALQAVLPQLGPAPSLRDLLQSLPDPRGGQPYRSTPNLAPASLPTYAGASRAPISAPTPPSGVSPWKKGLAAGLLVLGLLAVGGLGWWMLRTPPPGDGPVSVGENPGPSRTSANPTSQGAAATANVGSLVPPEAGPGGAGQSSGGPSAAGGTQQSAPGTRPAEAVPGSTSSSAAAMGVQRPGGEQSTGPSSQGETAGSSRPVPAGTPTVTPAVKAAGRSTPKSEAHASKVPGRASSPTEEPSDERGPASREAAASQEGHLILGSAPPDADVYKGSSKLCEVPCDIYLPAGTYSLELRSHDGHASKKFTAEVEPGRTRKMIWDFDAQAWLAR